MENRHNWALVTGAIRNDFYLSTILIKLCEMRNRGSLDGIVLSTWEGDIDKFPRLRDNLHKIGVEIVESKEINTSAAALYDQIAYERQWTTLNAGLKIIPDDCFVLKLRTDFVNGISPFLRLVEDGNADLSVKTYGSFNLLYNYKIVYHIMGIQHLCFVNDRFFYGYKLDLLKNNTHIYEKTHRFRRNVDNILTNGFSFQNMPLLSNVWNFISVEFYNQFIQYCRSVPKEEGLTLPKIILRVYATLCVHIYCHIYMTNTANNTCCNNPVSLLDFFRNRTITNMQIEKIVMGDLVPSQISNDFKEELRKIALDLPESKQFTYQEYLELKEFAENQLKDTSLIAEYPYIINDKKELCDGKAACEILFSDNWDEKLKKAFTDEVFMDFNGVEKSIFNKIPINEFGENKISAIKAAVFDRSSKAMFLFCKGIINNIQVYDADTWNQLVRNILLNARVSSIISYDIAAIYLTSKIYKLFLRSDPASDNAYLVMWKSLKNRPNIKYIGFKCGENFCQEDAYVNRMVVFLNEKATDGSFGRNEAEIAKALLLIAPNENPFSAGVIEKLEINGLKKEAEEAKIKYSDKPFDIGNFMTSDEAKNIVDDYRKGNIDIDRLLEYSCNVKGKADRIFLGTVILKEKWDYSVQKRTEIDEVLCNMTETLTDVPYVFQLNFLSAESMTALPQNAGLEEEWGLLLNIMKQKVMIGIYYDNLSKICANVLNNRMKLEAFARIEKDERIMFFSEKNDLEWWFNYRPFVLSEINSTLTVPKNAKGYLWPFSERPSRSSFAGFIKSKGSNCVYLSVELHASELKAAEDLLSNAGISDYQRANDSKIIRIFVNDYTFQNERDIANVVNSALDKFCDIGDRLVEAGKL